MAGAKQTVRQTNTTATGLDHVVIGSSTAPGLGATSITMSWTIPSADWAEIAVPIKASTPLTDVTVSDLTATLEANDVLVQWTTATSRRRWDSTSTAATEPEAASS